MRLSAVVAAPLLLTATTLARSPLRRGQTTDTCANLDAELVFPDVVVDDKPYDAGRIDVGLCISQVKTFVGHFNVTAAAVKVVGVDKVESAVTDLIKKAGVQCSYPPHTKPTVTSSSECDYICIDGFLEMPPNHPSSCICPPHLKECNGKCGHFHSDCTTTAPPSRRQNQPKCAKDLMMCGVTDSTSGQAFKCTDVTSDPLMCGGCTKASPFGSPSTDGVNCHNIANVADVFCEDSKCFVNACKSGFTVSASNDGCVPTLDGKTARGFPASGAGPVIDTATRPVDGVTHEESSDTIVPGSVTGNKVPRTDATSGLTRTVLSDGKVSPNGAPLDVSHDIPTGTKVPRGFSPLEGQGTNVVAGVMGKVGTNLTHDVDVDE